MLTGPLVPLGLGSFPPRSTGQLLQAIVPLEIWTLRSQSALPGSAAVSITLSSPMPPSWIFLHCQ